MGHWCKCKCSRGSIETITDDFHVIYKFDLKDFLPYVDDNEETFYLNRAYQLMIKFILALAEQISMIVVYPIHIYHFGQKIRT